MTEEPKLSWATKSFDDASVAAYLAKTLSGKGYIMINEKSHFGRHHLKLRHDRNGYFVRVGFRGSCKEYLGRCKVTYFGGEPTLLQFTFASHDAFDAEQQRLYEEKYGITP